MKYAGIGSRETPIDILVYMQELAKYFDEYGFLLRSGGADGADSAFAKGAMNKEIFLPWSGYNGSKGIVTVNNETLELASKFHPNWNRCSVGARKLHARNMNILLGKDLNDPVDFVICWTKDGKDSGGTGQAIRAALFYDIPVFNLFHGEEVVDNLSQFLNF